MQWITADHIHDGKGFLEPGTALAVNEQGQILQIAPLAGLDSTAVKRLEGIICPGFVNAHCHLELSHMAGQIPQHTGLIDFALHVIKGRNTQSPEAILEAAAEADRRMRINGIVAVGDICNTDHTMEIKRHSAIRYHSFIELIGLHPGRAAQIFESGKALQQAYIHQHLPATLAPHAPYSVSNALMELIAAEGATTSIHNQESESEGQFFHDKTGDVLKLYQSLSIPIDHFTAPGTSSIRSYLPHLKADANTALVHNTFSSADDIRFAETLSPRLFWCLCPNANLYIENHLPDVSLLLSQDCTICLGTDSLASNHGLSIASEMETLLTHIPGLSLEDLITWATYNGALFLNIDKTHGSLTPGTTPGINLLRQKSQQLSVEKLF